jgi:lysozyme
MSAVDLAVTRLATEEGFRGLAYRDTVGKLTIGYGCNIDAGWSQGLARAVLAYQTQDVANALNAQWWAKGLDDARLSALIDIGFNDGIHSLLGFPKMLAAVGAKNWQVAHDECLNSDAARQLPGRYKALAQILLTGVA